MGTLPLSQTVILEIFKSVFSLPITPWELLHGPKCPKLHYVCLEKTQRTCKVYESLLGMTARGL